jgi:hypothetical protein
MLKIATDDLLSFIIEYSNDEVKRNAVLVLQQGGWYLADNNKSKWVANPTIDWPEALKRSLIIVT